MSEKRDLYDTVVHGYEKTRDALGIKENSVADYALSITAASAAGALVGAKVAAVLTGKAAVTTLATLSPTARERIRKKFLDY